MSTHYDEDHHPVSAVDFDYEQLDHPTIRATIDQEAREKAEQALRSLLLWVYGDRLSMERIRQRSLIVLYVFVHDLRERPLSEIARKVHRHKQSLHKQLQNFRRAFPAVKIPRKKPKSYVAH